MQQEAHQPHHRLLQLLDQGSLLLESMEVDQVHHQQLVVNRLFLLGNWLVREDRLVVVVVTLHLLRLVLVLRRRRLRLLVAGKVQRKEEELMRFRHDQQLKESKSLLQLIRG